MKTLTLVVGAALLCAPAYAKNKQQKVQMAKAAKTTLDAALGKATAKWPGKAVEAELKRKRGQVVWEVEVLGEDGKLKEVDVATDTGEVVDSEAKK